MKLPKKIKILSHEIEVVFPYVFAYDKENHNGTSSWDEGKIWIEGGMTDTGILATFLHEILEILNTAYFDMPFGSDDEKEQKICIISEALAQILTDNDYLEEKK